MSGPRVLEACLDDHVSRARWLEAELTGPVLGGVLDELAVIRESERRVAAPVDDVRRFLAGDADAVLRDGLVALPKGKLDELFRSPWLLPGLQELVLVEGGSYWNDAVGRSEVLAATSKFHRRELARRLGLHEPREESLEPVEGAGADPRAGSHWRRLLSIGGPLAIAASVIAAVVLPRLATMPPEPPVQAPIRQNGLPETRETSGGGAGDLVGQLATRIDGWSRMLRSSDLPSARQAVATVVDEARRAIGTTIDGLEGEAPPIGEPRRTERLAQWLEKCRGTAAKLDEIERELSTSEGDPGIVDRERQKLLKALEAFRDSSSVPAGADVHGT